MAHSDALPPFKRLAAQKSSSNTFNNAPMKFLFDIFPVVLFFGVFKVAEYFPNDALALATRLLGDGVTPSTAPVFLATVTAIISTILQIVLMRIRGMKIEPMLWLSLAVIVLFGSLTLWLKNEMFIKWKPTILYWIFAGILGWGTFKGRNFMRVVMKGSFEMSESAWKRLQNMWTEFFLTVGALNLAIAYTCSTETWVNFKLFGLLSLTFIFTIGTALWMTRQASERQN